MNPIKRLFGGRAKLDIPPFGGDVRPAVMGPTNIKGQLAFYAAIRTFLLTVIVVVAVAVLVLAWRTPSIMGTELFVADGSALGCHVPSFYVE